MYISLSISKLVSFKFEVSIMSLWPNLVLKTILTTSEAVKPYYLFYESS